MRSEVSQPPLERMVLAWELIRTGKLPTCSTIAARLQVDPKTVLRDLVFMRDRLGFAFEFDRQQGGYVVTPGADRRCAFCGSGDGKQPSPRNGILNRLYGC